MKDFTVVLDKSLVDVGLLLQNEPSLPEAMRQLNLSEAFVGMEGKLPVAVCLLAKRKGYYEIVNLAVKDIRQDSGLDRELLTYVLDYARVQGVRFVEVGVGNADLRRHEMLLCLGFRVVGVWRDYYVQDGRSVSPGGGIVNRDMLRYRAALDELSGPQFPAQ